MGTQSHAAQTHLNEAGSAREALSHTSGAVYDNARQSVAAGLMQGA